MAEIRFGDAGRRAYPDQAMRSLLYALLAATTKLGIARDDVDGTLHSFGKDHAAALVIFDAVPGGAGHARSLGERLFELFQAALDLAESCDCAATESCYGCLRTYGNQIYHEQLVRGDAAALLRHVLGDTSGETDLGLFSPLVFELLAAAVALGAPVPVAGFLLDDGEQMGWEVEAAWPDNEVTVVIDVNQHRDRWLTENGWVSRHLHEWTAAELAAELVGRS